MENLIGKKLRLKGTSNIKTVTNVKDGKVYFSDNGVVDTTKINEHFEFVETPQFHTTQATPVYNTPISPIVEEQPLDPNNFFNRTSTYNTIIKEADQFLSNPEEFYKKTQAELLSETTSYKNGIPVSGISEDTLRQIKQQEMDAKKNIENAKNDPWLTSQFDKNGKQKTAPKFSSNAEELEYINSVNRGEIPLNQPTQQMQSTTSITTNSTLAKMRRTNKIKLIVELNEMIPKAEDIKAVESVLDMSLVDVLADEIAFKYLNDTELFKNLIRSELERLVYAKKKPKSTIKKVKTDA